jgi:hypothetical protein
MKCVILSVDEDTMFKPAFTLSFWGLLRIGEIALSKGNNAGQILAVDDVKLTLNKYTWQNGY